MKNLNTIPIEEFLEKSKIAIRTNQKNLTFSIREITDLQNSIKAVLTYLENLPEKSSEPEVIEVRMDGGKF